ncbi:cation transporter [Saccharophagus sp. K07]|uniref:cation diffusion facilitator family transporter n=1 Tax=Saccharophagus sp. K07 TaxID=2283636 RepID=UPI00165280A9|nr:cation diffusion facilitator family transporter [Saccharophagus sp. K07]MBC6905031.1 cation transporter [Saccharophagus sp. K07]
MHNHDHHQNKSSSRIAWAFFLNVTFTIIEFIGGVLTNSTAIMADAVHDLGDSLSIALAWILAKLGNKPASQSFSYGYKRLSLLGSLVNGMVLIAGSAWVLYQSIPRLSNPEMPVTEGMLALSIFGIAVNGFAAFKLSKGKTMNEKVLNWHLLEDVLGWVAVFIVSIVLMFVEWPILDPILAIGFTLFILFNVLRNVGSTLKLFLQGVPDKNLAKKIEDKLKSIPEFQSFHHLHLWSLDGEHHVLTVHIELYADISLEAQRSLKSQLSDELAEFALSHTTVEFELHGESCRDDKSNMNSQT